MECRILGPLRVVVDGSDRTPGSAQQRRLLALLASHTPGVVPITTIEDLLWPDGAPSANALQALVSKSRKVVDPATIVAEGSGYALRGVDTDVAEFERLVAAGRSTDAEGLVRGRALDDLDDAPIALALRARLDGAVAATRTTRLTAAVDRDPLESIAELAALVVEQPLTEDWWRLLMLAEYRAGRPADALRTYQRARATFVEQLGVEPGRELVALEHRILERDESLTTPAGSGSAGTPARLPAPIGTFVGRRRELALLEAALRSHRLLTLVGPGGAGKTTTSVELARRSSPEVARWVGLASLTGRDAIIRAITVAIGLPESEQGVPGTIGQYGDPLDRVVDALARSEVLLVIDNCEHVVDEVAPLIHRLLVECPGVRVVATSRERLAVPGEHLVDLPPLLPDEAVALFIERAAGNGVTVDPADTDRIRMLCERLDGLPLAIELAAARLRTSTVAQLIDGLDDRFTLLSRGARTVAPRQRTLRAVVDWSHDLLDPVEQAVFRRLAAFVGGCDAAAARSVCAGTATVGADVEAIVGASDVDEALDRLVDKSLVVAGPTALGMRFELLETIRAYAWERLVESGELDVVLVRHAQHVADTVRPAMRELLSAAQRRWLGRLAAERQNIEAALRTAVANDDAQLALEIVTPLGWYFFMTGELGPGRELLDDALACPGESEVELRATALAFAGWLAANGPNIERAVAITGSAMDLTDRVDDPWARAVIADMHAMSQFFAGRLDAVERFLPEVRRLADESGDTWAKAITKVVVGEMLQFRGGSLDAEREYVEAAEMFDTVGDRFAYALAITEASEIAEQFGHYDRAVAMLEHGIAIAEDVGFSSHPSAMRARLGNIEVLRGNLDAAERHHRSLIDDPVAAGVPWLQAMARFGLAIIARRRDRLDEAKHHLDAAWALPRSRSVPYLRSLLLVSNGFLADQRGDAAGAIDWQRRALDVTEQLATPRGTAYSLEGCAGALALDGTVEAARLGARLLGRADRLRRDSGAAMPAAERFDVDRAERRLRAQLGDRFDVEVAAGVGIETSTLLDEVRTFPVSARSAH